MHSKYKKNTMYSSQSHVLTFWVKKMTHFSNPVKTQEVNVSIRVGLLTFRGTSVWLGECWVGVFSPHN